MRILCLLDFVFHENGLLWGLRESGCALKVLDGQPVIRRQLIAACEEFRPDLILGYAWWLGRLQPEDLSWIKKRFHIPLVYWATDDPTHHEAISMPMARAADLVLTTTEEMLPVYHRMGRKASLLLMACNPNLHRRVDPADEERHDLVLVARNYHLKFVETSFRLECLARMVTPLVDAGLDFMAYGGGWDEVQRPFHIPSRFAGPDIPYQRLARVYAAAKIVLGLQSECHWTQTTHRLFEALGCGAFHLAPSTRATSRLFIPGRHLAVSHSPGETLALARHYLAHPEERKRIAAAGQLEVYRKHTYLHRAREFLAMAAEVL